ncbi:MAG: XRE family transcriptional regulator [Clostridia bacterium]|nr:XRE family transcriptional regulator [Clostridia bacterium]
MDVQFIGSRIKELRQSKGITQSELADALVVSFQAVSNWERGITPPDVENLIRIAAYFGVLVDDLLRPKNDDVYLGIDGGATKTEFAAVSSDGTVLKRIIKKGCNPNDIGFAKTEELIFEGVREICVDFPSLKTVFCGIAGISTGNYRERLQERFGKYFPQLKVKIKTDAFNLFAMVDGVNMSVISGTGSVVFVRCGEDYKRIGGWGHLFDSAGSAFDIGRDAVRQALLEEDMNQKRSVMSKRLLKKLNTSSVWEHINVIYNEGKPYIAGLASVVFEAYREGDENAVSIIDNNARSLANLLDAGVNIYGVKPIAIASGGIFEHYSDIMIPHIKKYSNVELLIIDLPPILGACRYACSMAGHDISESFTTNFKISYGDRR